MRRKNNFLRYGLFHRNNIIRFVGSINSFQVAALQSDMLNGTVIFVPRKT